MARYRPPKIKGDFDGDVGFAKVEISKSGKSVRVTFLGDDKKEYIVKKDKCPSTVQAGTWAVRMSGDGQKLMNIRPISGVYKGKVVKFAKQGDEAPAPRTNEKWGYQYFTILIEITDPEKVRGMEVPAIFRYYFGEMVDDGGNHVVGYTKLGSKYAPLLSDFMDASGAWDKGPMKYKDNVLPWIEKRILEADKEFQFVMKDSWLDSFILEDVDYEGSLVLPEEEIPWDEEE
jgi:hypothetical protein